MARALLTALCAIALQPALLSETEELAFEHEGKRLVGLFDAPDAVEARSLLLVVHGHGRTNVVAQNWYATLRKRMVSIGVATYMWDKPGCGQSEGTYDHMRPVQQEAKEVRAAMRHLRAIGAPGAEAIGFFGSSRAGWTVPLVIASERDARFWISVSGTSATENFGYLLRENLRIEGRSDAEIEALHAEWMAANEVLRTGGTYEEARRVSSRLRGDPFMKEFFPGLSKDDFLLHQEQLIESNPVVDPETGLLIYIEGFEEVLQQVECPVLAVFGERDRNVDWRETRALYESTLGAREPSLLTVRTFPQGNHNLKKCETGGWRETMANLQTAEPCDGYYEALTRWLVDVEAGIATDTKR